MPLQSEFYNLRHCNDRQDPQGTANPLHPIPNPVLQCYITPRLLSLSMESRPDHTHPEAWQTTSPTILLQAH
jgi:hypothetical protein